MSLDGETSKKGVGTAGGRNVGGSALLHRGSSNESREGGRNEDRLHDQDRARFDRRTPRNVVARQADKLLDTVSNIRLPSPLYTRRSPEPHRQPTPAETYHQHKQLQ